MAGPQESDAVEFLLQFTRASHEAGSFAGHLSSSSSRASSCSYPAAPAFTSALHLLTDQTVTGIAAAFDTFVTAMSIAYGLMVSTIVLPRHVRQIAP